MHVYSSFQGARDLVVSKVAQKSLKFDSKRPLLPNFGKWLVALSQFVLAVD